MGELATVLGLVVVGMEKWELGVLFIPAPMLERVIWIEGGELGEVLGLAPPVRTVEGVVVVVPVALAGDL